MESFGELDGARIDIDGDNFGSKRREKYLRVISGPTTQFQDACAGFDGETAEGRPLHPPGPLVRRHEKELIDEVIGEECRWRHLEITKRPQTMTETRDFAAHLGRSFHRNIKIPE